MHYPGVKRLFKNDGRWVWFFQNDHVPSTMTL
jgi:hypothetical protein